MKKSLFFLIGSFFFALSSVAQTNFPFPVADAEWITTRASGCIGGSIIYDTWREYLDGDTAVQGQTYQKLMLQPECTLQTQGTNCDYALNVYPGPPINIGAIHVDGQKVFFRKFTLPPPEAGVYEADLFDLPTGVDILLYDFGWSVGDTVAAPKNDGSAVLYKVTDVSFFPSGRKKISLLHLNGIGYTHLIMEGMGNTVGLLGNYSSLAASSYAPLPGCFHHNGMVIVDSGECQHCGAVGTNDETVGKMFSIFPNPADLSFQIETSSDNPSDFDLHIVSLLGQTIYRQNDFTGRLTVSCTDWPAQPYIVLLSKRANGQMWSEKLLIAR
ncbi:MAG: hypothetical protein JNL02_20470 [Saprospiraceae bacterium]|nr:hypothetical protein [Saprospiraceae bacterium]